MQVVMNKCFLLNPEKKLAQTCRFQKKKIIITLKSKLMHYNSEKKTHRAEG